MAGAAMAPGGGAAAQAAVPGVWDGHQDDTAVICCAEGLPAAARATLEAAGRSHENPARCRDLLGQASALAPDHPATLIAEYRFHFYGGRLDEALAVGWRCLDWAAATAGLAADWRRVRPVDAPFGSFAAALARFYLFGLKGCGYLLARLGEIERSAEILDKLCELDPNDHLGGRRLLQVLASHGRGDDGEAD